MSVYSGANIGPNACSPADRRDAGALSKDVETAHVRNCSGGDSYSRARGRSRAAVRERHGIVMGRLDRHAGATGGVGCVLAEFAACRTVWQAGLAAGSFFRTADLDRAGSLHRILRLHSRAVGHDLAERPLGPLLGRAHRYDSVPESARPWQRISVAPGF